MTIKKIDVLIVTTGIDAASDWVVRDLEQTGTRFFRLNTEDFPLVARSSVRAGANLSQTLWRLGHADVSLDDVNRVWYRRQRLPRLPATMVPAHAEYCLRESQWFVRGVLASLGERIPISSWMSHPLSVERAESKILQLNVAAAVGFRCPETLISNDPTTIREFFTEHQGAIIAKPLRLGYFDYGDSQTAVYTTLLTGTNLEDDASLTAAPVIYQQLIEKQYDVRVTIVQDQIFAAAIHSQDDLAAKIDWRRARTDLHHTLHTLPKTVSTSCLQLLKALQLSYGAIDLVLTPRGEYFFLEINPNGQWLWLEDKLGFPITSEIASWLREPT